MSSDRTALRLSRILSVLPWIIEHDGCEIDDLVERFDYRDRADLIKDLHLVFVTGLPGYGPGELIDVDISDDDVSVSAAEYFSQAVRLTAPEALGLLASGLTFIESGQAPPSLVSAVEKLTLAVIPDAGSTVSFDVPTPHSVEELRRSVESHRVVRIVYVSISTNERTLREVEGHSIHFNLGNWYLAGYCRRAAAERVFRIDRIASFIELEEEFPPRKTEHLGVVRYRPAVSDTHVSFTTDPSSRWVSEYYPVDAEDLENGSQRITMSVSDPLVAARLLIQLGDSASDIEGSVVVTAVEDLKQRIRDRYRA